MTIQTVRPNDGTHEARWVFSAIIFVIAITALLMPLNQHKQKGNEYNESYIYTEQLSTLTRAFIADLKLAHEEIRDLHSHTVMQGERAWPTPQQLEQEWLAPFTQDKTWHRYGQHQWQLIGDGFYLGVPDTSELAPSVILSSLNQASVIWLAAAEAKLPKPEDLTSNHLEDLGWKQVLLTSSR